LRIKNLQSLLDNAPSEKSREARRLALLAAERAVDAADPKEAVSRFIELEDGVIRLSDGSLIGPVKRVFVVGAGKAAGKMAEALWELFGEKISAGIVNVPAGTEKMVKTGRIRANPAGHPIPDEGTLRGTEEMLDMLSSAEEGDLVVCVISGGGSALLERPLPGISLSDLIELNRILLRSGANIHEINSVRKHVSMVKGGRLAAATRARVLSLIISDVIGDPLDTIASGPTAPDTTTFLHALRVLKKYDLVEDVPPSVLRALREGSEGRLPETPKPGDEVFSRVRNVIVASNSQSVRAAASYLEEEGLSVINLGSFVEGEARHVGVVLAGIGQGILHQSRPAPPPAAVVCGGETTVHVTGGGLGGRNQELVLGAVEKISGEEGICILSLGTDGIDGVTDAAGALADGHTYDRAMERGMDPSDYLKDNDSYNFFKELGDLIFTGPTLTNVMDVMVVVALG